MNEEAIDRIISENPRLKGSRQKLEAMQPGSYCLHRSWGFGKIRTYDEARNKLIIDFEGDRNDHAMDPAFCLGKLEILPPENLLVRQKADPSTIDDLIKNKPADIIADILTHSPGNAAVSSEIERILERLIGPTKYKKWWTSTKKLLVKDPRIAIPAKKSDPYFLREQPMKPEEEILQEFAIHKNPQKKILLAEKLYLLSDTAEEIAHELPNILETLTDAIKTANRLNQADRLHGVWVRNDLARHLHEDVDALEPSSASLIKETEDLSLLAAELPSAYFKRFLDLITLVYPEEWQLVLLDLFRESSGKFTQECAAFLVEHDCEKLLKDRLAKWLVEQALKGPVILWILKNRNSRKYSKILQPLISPRLLSAALYAIDYIALHSNSTRRIPLADVLSEDTHLIADILTTATAETAHDLAQTLLANQGFEQLTKKSLLARFIKSFPSVQELLSSGDSQPDEDESLIVSQASLDRYKKEYEILIAEKIPENKAAIVAAREHGDLKENSEYKMARQDQDTLMARKAQLEKEMLRARVSDFTEAPTESVGVGSTVVLMEGSTGDIHTYSILGAWDSDPKNNILSYKTPLSQSLMGKRTGDSVTLTIGQTEEQWTVKKIDRWVDTALQHKVNA